MSLPTLVNEVLKIFTVTTNFSLGDAIGDVQSSCVVIIIITIVRNRLVTEALEDFGPCVIVVVELVLSRMFLY